MSHIEQTHCLVHTFSNRHVCSWRHFLAYLYSHFSHFSDITKKKKSILHSPHFVIVIFVRLFCKLSSSGSSDSYHFGGTRFVLSWETIVHYHRYKLRGQIRLKDTTLSLGSDLLSNYCLYCRFGSFVFFWFLFFKRTRMHCFCLENEHGNYTLKTNFTSVRFEFVLFVSNLFLFITVFLFSVSVRLQNFISFNLRN